MEYDDTKILDKLGEYAELLPDYKELMYKKYVISKMSKEEIRRLNSLIAERKEEINQCVLDNVKEMYSQDDMDYRKVDRVWLAKKLVDSGFTAQEVAYRFDVDVRTIRRWLKE